MSSHIRNYVKPGRPMYRAAAYDLVTGECVASTGPYAERGPALASRSRLARRCRRGRRVVVETCTPTWAAIDGTEVTA